MSTLVRTTKHTIDRETLETFLKFTKIFQCHSFFNELFKELKNLKISSDIIGFITQSIISIQLNIQKLFDSIGIIIPEEQLESPIETYYSSKYWYQIFTEYLNCEQQRKYRENYQNRFIPIMDLIAFLKSFYSPEEFKVYVKTLTGRMIELYISSQTTIHEIKEMIQKKDGTPVDQQRLIFAGRQLEVSQLVGMYNISHKATLHLVLTLRGGMHHKSSTGKLMDECEIMYTQMKEHMSPELCEIFDEHFESA